MSDDTRDPMGCEEIRELLWPMDRPREVVAGEARAREHVENCPKCQAFFERDVLISRSLRGQGVAERAPAHLRERVFDALARERMMTADRGTLSSRVGRIAPWAAVAAMAGLAFGLARAAPTIQSQPIVATAYAQDFLSRAVEADAVETPNLQAISAFFMRELGVPVTPIMLDGARLNRAMICLIDGERAAMVEYELDGYTLAHYRVPAGSETGVTRNPAVSDEDGVCVYRWSDGQFDHALVSDMPEQRLGEIVLARFSPTTP